MEKNKKLRLPFGFVLKSFLNSENQRFSDCSFCNELGEQNKHDKKEAEK